MRFLLSALVLLLFAPAAWAQSPNLTQTELIERYNARLAKDGQDRVKSCWQRKADQFLCSFVDAQFRTTLDDNTDITGSIDASIAPTSMIIITVGDHIDTIDLMGDRGRPADLINFTAHFESLLHVLGPTKSDYQVEMDTLNLGLVRGDKDADIGQEREVSESFAKIQCLNRPWNVSVGIGCVIKLLPQP